ncbi:hypothetical protein LSH36_65g09010 [Paralvinella palmiformis]|uniref:G-protein coupled receptors family 1 profile domain-containing protein n=1 Tax=Paralvinella palmiformis TaxID=53620 RepID=A0AAD9K5H1_9ANNE|nr:hypothetical protein LSH36_65g09010 [Paralvinella palmiformis]
MEQYVTDYMRPFPLERGFLTDLNGSWQSENRDPSDNGSQLVDMCALQSVMDSGGENGTHSHDAIQILEDIKFYVRRYVNPGVCVFGIIGNVFNLLVLTRRRLQSTMDCSMERAAHLGLIILAISDMLYCLVTLPTAFLARGQVLFTEDQLLLMYIQMYQQCFQNIFVHTSIWLTVIMAAGRYAAICRPLQARYLVGINATRVAVTSTFVLWTLLELPRFWSSVILHEFACPRAGVIGVGQAATIRYYIVDLGPFLMNATLKITFDYIWSIMGFFIPISVLAYCNIHLIQALRESSRVRQLYRVHPRSTTHGSRITPTLVAIVCLLIVFVSPSEFLHFYFFIVKGSSVEPFNFAIVITNLLQSLNFSCNFVLYCLVNVHFRETCKDLVYCKACRRTYSRVERRTGASAHNVLSTKASFLAQSSFETVI